MCWVLMWVSDKLQARGIVGKGYSCHTLLCNNVSFDFKGINNSLIFIIINIKYLYVLLITRTAHHVHWHTGQQQRTSIAVCPWPAYSWSSSCGPSSLLVLPLLHLPSSVQQSALLETVYLHLDDIPYLSLSSWCSDQMVTCAVLFTLLIYKQIFINTVLVDHNFLATFLFDLSSQDTTNEHSWSVGKYIHAFPYSCDFIIHVK